MSARGRDNCVVVPPRLSLLARSHSLCPILSGVRPPRIERERERGQKERKKQGSKRGREEEGGKKDGERGT